MENYARRAYDALSFRVDRRLRGAAVAKAHDEFYESDAWTKATWLGTQALKNPLDLWIYQEIMAETRPEVVVETGTYRGGSALYLASVCDLLGTGEVVSIDIEPARDDYPSTRASRTSPGGRRPIRTSSRRSRRGPTGSRFSSSSTPITRRATSRRSSRPTRRSFPSAAT